MRFCTGCGSTKTIEEIRAENPAALSCCPERHMTEMDEYEKSIREKVFAAGILTPGEWVYLVGVFGAAHDLSEIQRES